jgi:hypothetical protein
VAPSLSGKTCALRATDLASSGTDTPQHVNAIVSKSSKSLHAVSFTLLYIQGIIIVLSFCHVVFKPSTKK